MAAEFASEDFSFSCSLGGGGRYFSVALVQVSRAAKTAQKSIRRVLKVSWGLPTESPKKVAGVLRGNTIRGNTTRNSERKMAL